MPLAFLGLLGEQVGRKLLQMHWLAEREGTTAGTSINAALLGIIAMGLILSLWRRRTAAGGA